MTNPISARKGTPVAVGCGVWFKYSAKIATVTIELKESKTAVLKEPEKLCREAALTSRHEQP